VSKYRVLRGGSYGIASRFLRATYRDRDVPEDWYRNCGFRIVIRRVKT
jgi:formylglycine-generating enzyme required for sulfatase activity